jgi:hypothetical protein
MADNWSKQCTYGWTPGNTYYEFIMKFSYCSYSNPTIATINYAMIINYWNKNAQLTNPAVIDSFVSGTYN